MHYTKKTAGLVKTGAKSFLKSKSGKKLLLNTKTKLLATKAVKKASKLVNISKELLE